MTRYDPFSYGSVRLDPGAPEDAKAHDAEDMLFSTGEAVKQAPPAGDGWALMDQEVGDLLPGNGSPFADAGDFGAEILGEATNAKIPLESQEPIRRPETGVRPPVEELAASEEAPRSAVANRREVRRRELPSVRPVPAQAAPAARPAAPRRRRSGALAVVVPLTLFAGGGSAAAWFWTMQHNPVMAGILGATTLVGALFAWLLLRP